MSSSYEEFLLMMSYSKLPHIASLALIYDSFGPYHLARLEHITKIAESQGMDVFGIELAHREIIYPWVADPSTQQTRKYTLFPHNAVEEISTTAMVRAIWTMLNHCNPDALALAGFKTPGMFTALMWAWLKRKVVVALMDSKYDDHHRPFIKEWLRKKIFSLFDAALVGGSHSKAYAEILGMSSQKIFIGSDVIDNQYFTIKSDWARDNDTHLRNSYQLPDNYFLVVSRFIEKKNIARLLEAYSHYTSLSADQAWSLVICGSGPLEAELKNQADKLQLKRVLFPGFKQIDVLPIYYGLARCFIIPSAHDEQWGLVVNEAMASGLPVLVSRACGCAADLVQEGVNGFPFDPYNVKALAELMATMASGEVNLPAMAAASRRIIADWSLETFAQHLLEAVKVGMAPAKQFHELAQP